MKESAKEYLKYGFNCIPVNADKTPACDWKHFQKNKVSEMGLFTSDAIGVVCGSISDNLEVLDFDNHGSTATDNLKSFIENPLVKTIYDKYKLPIIQTQSGGYHIYLRCDKIGTNQKLAMVKLNGKPDAIIETRGEGGYVLAPPSKGYKLIRNTFKDLQFITGQERTILIQVAKSFNEHQKSVKQFKPSLSDDKPGTIYDNLPESIEEAKNILRSVGWSECGFNNAWTRPGKKGGVSATFGNIAPNVFYSFSSNIEYFDFETGYTPFQIKGLVEYNGDFSKLASDLAKKYNLSRAIEEKKEPENNDLIKRIYKESKLDWSKEYKQPEFIIKIKNGTRLLNIGSLGNFTAITGKSKSRKSFFRLFIEAACISNKTIQNKFFVNLPKDKQNILYFDTEQGISNVFNSAYRAVSMANVKSIDNYQVFALRNYGYQDRCFAIEEIIKKTSNLGVVFIDGVADLAFGNNDEAEGNRVVQLLMSWTATYNIHICTVIHQPKGADWATGHLGSAIEKKAEAVINVKKEGNYSIVEPKQLRNSEDFAPFPFLINSDIQPEIITEDTVVNELFDNDI